MSRSSLFSAVTQIRPTAAGFFDVDVHPDWSVGGKPNGGYLLAMLGRAAAMSSERPHVTAASAHFLRAPDPGTAVVETEVLRHGRTVSQVRARLLQGGRPAVEALLVTGTLDESATPRWSGGVPDPEMAAFDICVRLPPSTPGGGAVPILSQADVRVDPATLDFQCGRPTGHGEIRGWLRIPGEDRLDAAALLYAVDALPPATFDIEFTGWVPTVELTAYVRALPVPGPVRVLQRARLIDGDRVDEVSFVWDAAGRLVAQATQLAAIRFA